MGLSGIIFVVLAVAWAVFLIPKALHHHDQAARTRSIDRFSSKMRVLAHREPVNRGEARLVVAPVRVAARVRPAAAAPQAAATASAVQAEVLVAGPVTTQVRPAVPRARLQARRAAARAAARRRRRILGVLLLATVVTAALASVAVAPWWSSAVAGGLTLAFLVLCRTQVRHESLADVEPRAPRVDAEETVADEVAEVVAEQVVAEVTVDAEQVADFDENEDTIGIPVAALQAALAPTEDGGTLWDPLPVTLPTYVTKPRAHRTVRTINLGEPGTWTSGHTAADTEIASQAADEQAVESESVESRRRAVGS